MKHLAAFLAIALVRGVASASAQEETTAPPSEQAIEPDRPDVTNGTHIVDAGLVQLEMGGLYTHAGAGQHAFGSPFTARVGLKPWLEARIGTDGLLTSTDGTASQTGLGNTQIGAKLRLWANPGGVPVLSVLPSINFPTADSAKGFGSGETDYTIAILTGTDIGRHWHADVNYGIGSIGSGDTRSRFAQHLASVSVSVAASDNWNPYIETFWFSKQDIDSGALTAVDAGAVYELGTRMAVDGGIQVSRVDGTYQFAAFGGLSMVIGDILHGHGVHSRNRQDQTRGAHKPRPEGR